MIKRMHNLSEADKAAMGIITNEQFHASKRERYAKSRGVRERMAKQRPWMLYDWEKDATMESGKPTKEGEQESEKSPTEA